MVGFSPTSAKERDNIFVIINAEALLYPCSSALVLCSGWLPEKMMRITLGIVIFHYKI